MAARIKRGQSHRPTRQRLTPDERRIQDLDVARRYTAWEGTVEDFLAGEDYTRETLYRILERTGTPTKQAQRSRANATAGDKDLREVLELWQAKEAGEITEAFFARKMAGYAKTHLPES